MTNSTVTFLVIGSACGFVAYILCIIALIKINCVQEKNNALTTRINASPTYEYVLMRFNTVNTRVADIAERNAQNAKVIADVARAASDSFSALIAKKVRRNK